MPEYLLAATETEFSAAARLFTEYAAGLAIDLGFQHFEEELKNLDRMYARTDGGILLCKNEGDFVACAAIRRFSDEACELKRMFVQPAHRQRGIGEHLMQRSVELAVQCGYSRIMLDTLDHMKAAIGLYKKFGFVQTEPYYHNPIESAVYFELKLPVSHS
jgi:ribosomal protein S18 acetylase RimI-like enzyme